MLKSKAIPGGVVVAILSSSSAAGSMFIPVHGHTVCILTLMIHWLVQTVPIPSVLILPGLQLGRLQLQLLLLLMVHYSRKNRFPWQRRQVYFQLAGSPETHSGLA